MFRFNYIMLTVMTALSVLFLSSLTVSLCVLCNNNHTPYCWQHNDYCWDWEYIKQNTRTVSLSVTLPVNLSASEILFARTECMKTVMFTARRREGVVVTLVGVINNTTLVKYICNTTIDIIYICTYIHIHDIHFFLNSSLSMMVLS
jgi:hypothetical protein